MFKFSDYLNASECAYRSKKPMRIIHGDDGRYWVVCPAEAERLVKGGHEYAD